MARAVVVSQKGRGKLCSVDVVTIDATMDETHDLANTVTDHPVEEGSPISDHSRPEPDRVTLRCFISNTPLSTEQQQRAIQEGVFKFQTTAARAVEIGAVDGRGAQAFAALKKLRDEGTLVKVVTTLKTYAVSSSEGMIVEHLTVPRTLQDYDGLAFTIVLKQIRIVRNRQTRQRVSNDRRVGAKTKRGAQTTNKAQASNDNSALFNATNSQTAKNMAKSDNPLVGAVGRFGVSLGAGPQ